MTTTSDRNLYLRRCAMVSLRKRWYYALLIALLLGAGTFLITNAVIPSLLVALLACATTLAVIAMNSMRRHSDDLI